MKTIQLLSIGVLLSGLSFTSCKKEGCTDPEAENYSEEAKKDDGSCTYADKTGTVQVVIDHNWGMMGAAFQMNTDLKHPMSGDTLNFSTFKYYISNFRLKNSDGSWWTHPESYFLVDLSDGVQETLTLNDVPEGTYTEMSYILGVDSARNVSGAQTGALAVSNNMFWSWTTGYIMLKAEGTSPQSGNGNFTYHLGGFEGANNVVTSKTAAFGSESLVVGDATTSSVHMIGNPAKLFHTYGSVSNGAMIHMPGTDAVTMTSDYYGGFAFDYVQN
jgi:hypothetical protein